jgi:hypothetical protein
MTTPLFTLLEERFHKNMHRHQGIEWSQVREHLEKSDKISSLEAMESTGGEPDVVGYDTEKNRVIFMDCSAESPIGRRSLCYDRSALESRKEHTPSDSVIDMAKNMGITLLSEDEYRYLQSIESIDQKTSSWILTPVDIRKLGGAIFCDRRYNTVFTYHNGADSYYAARGWRGSVRI